MPSASQTRIAEEQNNPRIIALWRAVTRLKTVVSFMNTGAHPDDETSAMLAAFSMRDGIDISYACSTRGEGGQNDIGQESSAALGVLRTAEMERACDVLGLRMYWHSTSPDDTIFDFGFSKSGVETMEKWGRARTLARFVDIVRTERPDIICPTFLDIPGQHGHHRAMTEAAHLVMDLAADETFEGSNLPIWQVKKLYLPAWSGAGQAYDDDLPPPPTTLTVQADGVDPVTGWSYERIAQQSRAFHRTQAMGRWVAAGEERNWPLHLAQSHVDGPDDSVFSGLAYDLRDLGLGAVQDHIDACIAAFPDFETMAAEASAALATLNNAQFRPDDAHKIRRKQEQLAHVIRIASGVQVHARLERSILHRNDATRVVVEKRGTCQTRLSLPDGWKDTKDGVRLKGAGLSDPYPDTYLPDQPSDPCVIVTVERDGAISETRIPFEHEPLVVPNRTADLSPMAEVVNLSSDRRTIQLRLNNVAPETAVAELVAPTGWDTQRTDAGFAVTIGSNVTEGVEMLSLTLDGKPAHSVRFIKHAHTAQRALTRTAAVRVAIVDVALPDVKVGYIGGGNDRVDHWLAQLGLDVTTITDDDLQSDARLAEFDTIVVGIFALKFRDGLADRMPRLHKWVANGGTLLTLYHRPWDNWDADTTPVKRLEIGQPSLRWRVTDEAADVTHLVDHPILTTPNEIRALDWDGWHKERGLYFAKSWDAAYTPLLQMADRDEAPHQGALLSADIGKGRHTHCALILHHQMEKLVPGAFRLMANLLAKRT